MYRMIVDTNTPLQPCPHSCDFILPRIAAVHKPRRKLHQTPSHPPLMYSLLCDVESISAVPLCSQAKPSQATPSQAKPSQAKPSHAKPSQATPNHAQPCPAKPSQAQPSPAQPSPANAARQAPSTPTSPAATKHDQAKRATTAQCEIRTRDLPATCNKTRLPRPLHRQTGTEAQVAFASGGLSQW